MFEQLADFVDAAAHTKLEISTCFGAIVLWGEIYGLDPEILQDIQAIPVGKLDIDDGWIFIQSVFIRRGVGFTNVFVVVL